MALPEPSSAERSPGRWRARWIWCEAPRIEMRSAGAPTIAADARGCFALLRRALDIGRVPEHVPARATADSRYVLFVNGREVARGPVRDNPRRLHFDALDLAPFLRPGANAIAALVRFYRDATPWWMPAVPTLTLGAGGFLFEADLGGDHRLASDRSWKAMRSPAWSELARHGIGAAPIEALDARLLPAGWREPGFDDASWDDAVELAPLYVGSTGIAEPPSHPYGVLLPRPIRFLDGARRSARVLALRCCEAGAEGDAVEDPVARAEADWRAGVPIEPVPGEAALTIAAGGTTVVALDFGEEVAGGMVLEVEAPAGTRFAFAAGEAFRSDGALDRLQQHNGFRYVARGESDDFETFDAIGLRAGLLSVRAERGPVVLRGLAVRERLFPRAPGAAFRCSDPLLDRVWTAGRRTVDLCSHDAYLDCPSREQRAWTGDSVVHQMVDLATHVDWSLARRHVELAASLRPDGMFPMAVASDMEAADATFIPDWPLHWVHALHNLHRYTGDRALLGRLLAPAECLLRWFEPFQQSDGLLADVTGWVLIDWSAVGTKGRCAALNALFARALVEFAEIAESLGDTGRARWARDVWARVAAGFERFWDEERGLYVDSVHDGIAQRPVSEHANAAALCARLVPAGRIARVAGVLLARDRLVRASWLLPGRTDAPPDGDMYAGAATLITGPPEPWWDVERQIVAAQPFFRYVVHDALAIAGHADEIPALCRDWGGLLARSATTLCETWFGGSRCHGWSATPTRDLIVYTLGVTPAAPGFAEARIAPRLGALEWARGAAATPHGWLVVSVDREHLEVDTPLPARVELAGQEARKLEPGRHRLKVEG